MIVFITSQNSDINSPVEDRFGRAPWYIKVDSESKKWEAFQNAAAEQRGGAGIAAGQFIIDNGAEAVISGDFGPNAARTLKAGNVSMYLLSSTSQTVSETLEQFVQGQLSAFE